MSRILVPFESGALTAPNGPVLYLNAQPGAVLAAFSDLLCVQDMRPVWNTLPENSLSSENAAVGPFDMVLVEITRDRNKNRALFSRAWDVIAPTGLIVVSGAKTDGVEAHLKELRKSLHVDGTLAKSHGKVFWVRRDQGQATPPDEWANHSELAPNKDGFLTAPGMFSHAEADAGSRLLADTLPEKIGRSVSDFGAGWGWLSAQVLTRTAVERLKLVEASFAALEAANRNIDDPRAEFIWGDVLAHASDEPDDTIIMNPPFHNGRAAEPNLGQKFIKSAARNLKPSGTLYMVANRHLPYESTLAETFRTTTKLADDNGFKVLMARSPLKSR